MDDILDRISKLMAKAKGTNNENEAAIFAAKAEELLAQHNLTLAQLEAREAEAAQEPVGEEEYKARAPDPWRRVLLTSAAELYFCTMLSFGSGKYQRLVVYGRPHNRAVAISMGEYLVATVKRMAREYSSDRALQGAFRRGAASSLNDRIRALIAERRMAEATTPTGDRSVPALRASEEQAVGTYVRSKFPEIKEKGSKLYGAGAAGAAGAEAGKRISLQTQVTERRASRLLK